MDYGKGLDDGGEMLKPQSVPLPTQRPTTNAFSDASNQVK
jgi:hypothetical protein